MSPTYHKPEQGPLARWATKKFYLYLVIIVIGLIAIFLEHLGWLR